MWITIPGFSLLLVLALAVLPVPRVRRLLLTAATRVGQAVLLAFLGMCGTFFVRPETAPDWLINAATPFFDGIRTVAPEAGAMPVGVLWLLLALFVVLLALPLLITLELAVSLSRQTALVQSLQKELRHVAAWVDSRLCAIGLTNSLPPISPEAQAATEVFRAASPADQTGSGTRVLDLMK